MATGLLSNDGHVRSWMIWMMWPYDAARTWLSTTWYDRKNFRLLLRIEGLLTLVAAIVLFDKLDYAEELFLFFFMAPDVGMLGYFFGSRIGAATYNATHTYVGPIALLLISLAMPTGEILGAVSLIWCAHVAFDRALGFGLKCGRTFFDTHVAQFDRAVSP